MLNGSLPYYTQINDYSSLGPLEPEVVERDEIPKLQAPSQAKSTPRSYVNVKEEGIYFLSFHEFMFLLLKN